MRSALVIMTTMLICAACLKPLPSRDTGPWTLFLDEQTGLYGYRDAGGTIKIPPKFIMAGAHEFHNIVAVVEQTGEKNFPGYYLLKTGKKVGIGNLYLRDNSPDCESEGKIRFRDAKTDSVGFFDNRGRVVIPAHYSDARPFRNNLAMVLKGAERVCPDGAPWSADNGTCEHWQWRGGRMFLINARNQVMIEDFPYTGSLDWCSLHVTDTRHPAPQRDSFKATDGRYWSFINVEKEFRHWFESTFLPSDTTDALEKCAFDEITYWAEDAGEWKQEHKDRFLKNAGPVLLQVIGRVRNGTLDYALHKNPLGLNRFIFHGSRYAAYFDTCRNSIDWQHPVFELVVSYHDENAGGTISHQDVFEFLRTADGVYRLISVCMRTAP
jgi:hypothetical protein